MIVALFVIGYVMVWLGVSVPLAILAERDGMLSPGVAGLLFGSLWPITLASFFAYWAGHHAGLAVESVAKWLTGGGGDVR